MRNFILFPETIYIHFPHGAYLRFPAMTAQNLPLRQKYYSKSSFLAQYLPAAMAIEYQGGHDCTNLTANNHSHRPSLSTMLLREQSPHPAQGKWNTLAQAFGKDTCGRMHWTAQRPLQKRSRAKAPIRSKKTIECSFAKDKENHGLRHAALLAGGLEIGAIFLVYEQPADRHNACKQNSSHRPHNPSRLPGIC